MHERMAKSPNPAVPAFAPGLERWDDVQLLLAIARAGSFTQAARQLGIEQSTVSRRMAGLERALGGQVFERERRRTGPDKRVLTPLGERLYHRAESVEASIVAFNDEVSGHERGVRGRVRLAVTESMAIHIVIPAVLPILAERYPDLVLDLFTGDTVADLGHREAEIAIRFFRPAAGQLVAKRVARLSTAVLAHRRYCGSTLDELPWVNVELPGVRTPEQVWMANHVKQPPTLVSNSYLTQIEAVRAGVGAALLTRSVKLLDEQLVELDLGLPPGPVLELWLVSPESLRDVPRVAAVWQTLEAALGALES